MSGPPPRQHELERRYKPFTHTFILTRRVWKDDYDVQMIFADLVGLKLPDICLKGEDKKPKKVTHEICLDRESNSGPLLERMTMTSKWYSGTLWVWSFLAFVLKMRTKSRKKPDPGNLFRPGIELRPAAWQANMLPPAPQCWTNWDLFYL